MAVVSAREEHVETGGESFPGKLLVYYKGKNMNLLSIDSLLQEIARPFLNVFAENVKTVPACTAAYLLLCLDGMDRAFAGLARYAGETMGCGAAVTIMGRLLSVETGEKRAGKGCAVLSVSVRKQRPAPYLNPQRKRAIRGMRDALTAIRKIIEKQNGSFRIRRGEGEVQLCMYLPILQGA
ncbi:MAG: hypothetical protein ABSE25_05825 [Syntrophorhabdales bacterium]|jgi:hypothetical protein